MFTGVLGSICGLSVLVSWVHLEGAACGSQALLPCLLVEI